jgi:hypothetical protein
MDKNEFAKQFGFGTFRESLMSTLDFTLDQLEFTEEEKASEVQRLEKLLSEFEKKVVDKFSGKFNEEEVALISKYLTQATPDYMEKYAQVHAELNEEFGNQILDRLESEE